MAAQGAEDGEEDLEDEENTDHDYAQDRENDGEFEATEEDLFQGGLYEPSVRIQVQGSEEGSEGPGGDGVRPRPGFSGDRGDYYIGRSRAKLPRHKDKEKDEWLQLLDLLRLHIFPWVEEGWKKDAIFRTTAEEKMQKMHLFANMLREELGILRGREMQLAMENAELREKLAAEREDKARVIAEFEAYKRSVAAWTDNANASAEVDGSSKNSGVGASQAAARSKAPVAVEDFFFVVVVSWREAETVAAAWKLWVQPSQIMGGKTLAEVWADFGRDRNKNNSFITAYSRFAAKGKSDMTVGACERKMRRVLRVMVSVETLRKDSSEAATATAVNLLDEVLALCNFTEFTNGLAVLQETPPNKKQKTGLSTEKMTVNDLAQRRVSWLLVKKGLRDKEWATSLFGDAEWEEIHKEQLAKEEAEEEKKRTAAAKKAELEKAKGDASKR
ncbi:unnamed protein product [Closterium sp. Naga37s-1]|nr:unnamed protein product [Closterium sp. Naga37s-1]